MANRVQVNRAPVLTLWAAVVAERLGHDRAKALALGKAVAGMNAVSKGRRLGIIDEPSDDEKKPRKRTRSVELLGRRVPLATTDKPATVERYLASKFGDSLDAVRDAMEALAGSMPKAVLAKRAYALYEKFRPDIPAGEKGWGAKGVLDLAKLKKLKTSGPPTS